MPVETVRANSKYFYIFIFQLILFFSVSPQAEGAELTLTSQMNKPFLMINVSLDKVEKLAGMKLAIDYPKDYLLVKDTKKSSNLNSFMDVVNDKTPGKLIIVVASANGVSGSNFKLFDLAFTLVQKDYSHSLTVKPTECQLMSESLQSIPCSISPLTVPKQ